MKPTLPYQINRRSPCRCLGRPWRFVYLMFTTNYHWRVAWRRAGE